MALHLIKLSVGSESLASLAAWQAEHRTTGAVAWHGTRMAPKRKAELLAGGSIYWVIQGLIQARQELRDIVPVVRNDGSRGVRIIFATPLIRVEPRPHRAFQGWRYLAADEAPPDLNGADIEKLASDKEPNPQFLRELRDAGLL